MRDSVEWGLHLPDIGAVPAQRAGYDRGLDGFGELMEPWPEVFSLMWDAYCIGTIPVGAVVVDAGGVVVSRGQNRIFDARTTNERGGSRLAHAEVNALANLGSESTYETSTLYTALEPCHMCLAAVFSVRLGSVRYAARDPYGGAVGKLLPSPDHEAHPVEVLGPLDGAPGLLPELLLVSHFLWRLPKGIVVDLYRRTRPEFVQAAKLMPPPRSDASLADAYTLASTASASFKGHS